MRILVTSLQAMFVGCRLLTDNRDGLGSKNPEFSFWSDKSLFCNSKVPVLTNRALWDFHWNQSKLSDKNLSLQIMTWPDGRKLVIRIYNFVGFSMSDKFSGFCKGKKWAFSEDNLGWKVQFLPWKSFNIYASADMRKKYLKSFHFIG